MLPSTMDMKGFVATKYVIIQAEFYISYTTYSNNNLLYINKCTENNSTLFLI